MQHRHQYEMGIIGNCAFLAYVEKNTNINWLCWPRFDSSFIFGRLVDEQKGGEFSILPVNNNFKSHQYYIENTNILCTEITTDEGAYRVIDFAPRSKIDQSYYDPLLLVRKIEHISGQPKVEIRCQAKGGYGEETLKAEKESDRIIFKGLEKDIHLKSDLSLDDILMAKPITLQKDCVISLSWGKIDHPPTEQLLRQTCHYWRQWVASCAIPSIYQKEVIRSCLALKLHQYGQSGAIIAAGSTSLPEAPGEGRNWDYRYYWVRDSYYTLEVFRKIGQYNELSRYARFIRDTIIKEKGDIQPLYTILGEKNIEEKILPLAGYQHEQPVRIGNEAYKQKQYDAYGQIILSIAPLYFDQRISPNKRLDDLTLIEYLLDGIERHIGKADAGIWELRESQDIHLYSALFHWAGASMALKIARHFHAEKMMKHAASIIKKAQRCIEKCYSQDLRCYLGNTQRDKIDATLLELINMHYLSDGETINRQLQLIEKHLCRDPYQLMMRYSYRDDFGVPAVSFLICSFWHVSALAKIGKVKKATKLFDTLIQSANHLGLLSEDTHFDDLSQFGNFVQSYSHVGLVNAAFELDAAMSTHAIT